jgi:CBS domain containing-hemolysin-like protein
MSAGTILLRLIGALALVAVNSFFVAVEFAVVAMRRTRIEQLVSEGHVVARLALKLIDNPDRVIAASQLGITMASLALGWIGEETVAAIIEPPLEALLGRWSMAAAHTIGTAIAFALVTAVHIVLGEQVPKTVAVRHTEKTLLTVAGPMDWFTRIFRPLIALLDGATAAVLRLLRTKPIAGHRVVFTQDEIKLIVRESQEGGAIEADQEEMLQKVFEFGERQVREVMIPRPDVVGIEKGASLQDLLDLFVEEKHARFPIYEENLDNIVGIVAVKDILLALAQNSMRLEGHIDRLVRPAVFVPETADVADLLTQMRTSHTQMAVILDEYGGTAGIVTVEELIEEIVGRLSDELITGEESVVRLDEMTAEIDALLRIDEVNEQLSLDLPEGEEYETLAGFILYRLQHIPAEGEVLHYPNLELKVTHMKGRKIERVQVHRTG